MSDLRLTIRDIRGLIVFTIFVLLAISVGLLAIWYAWRVLFLAFAGLLLAIILDSFTAWVQRVTGLSRKLAYLSVLLAIVVVCGLTAWFVVPRIIDESGQIAAVIPQSLRQLQDYLDKTEWGHYVVQVVQRDTSRMNAGAKVTMAASKALDALGGAVLILVVGFYGALNSKVYTHGLLRLVPRKWRDRAELLGDEILYTLRWWLLGQLVPMTFLGALTMVGLWALHVPLAFTLGLFTAVMIFIPYLGALVSEIPAVLVALQQGLHTTIYVLILYLAVHGLEAYVLTPLVQKRAARLPPIVTILSEFLLWSLAGVLGVAIATPLAAAVLVVLRHLYLHEQLEH